MRAGEKSSFHLMLLIVLSLITARQASSEEITVYGAPFEIDAMEHFGETTLKLTLDGRSFLISSNQLQYQVLKHFALKGDLKAKPFEDVSRILEKALEADDLRSVSVVLPFFALNNDVPPTVLEGVIKAIAKKESGQDILDRFWAEYSSQLAVKTQAQIIIIFLEDGKSSVVNIVPQSELEKELWILVENRIKGILEQEGSCDKFADSIVAAFGESNEKAKLTKQACALSAAAKTAENNNDVDSLLSILKSATDDLSRNLVEPTLVRTLHAKSASHISEGRYFEALTLLADVPSSRISPTTHELTLKAVLNIPDLFKEISLQSSTGQFLLSVSNKNENIKNALRRAVEGSVMLSAARADWNNVDAGLSFIGQSNNSDKTNDNIWYAVAIYAVSSGDLDKAQGYFNAQVGEIGLFKKLRFYLAGGYGGRWILVISSLFLVGLIFASRKAFRIRQRKAFQEIHENVSVGGIVEESKLSSEETRELNKSLVRLGLAPKASEQEIKNAFRDLAKKIHPDAKHEEASVDKSATDDFIELTKAYDIALKLTHKQTEVE